MSVGLEGRSPIDNWLLPRSNTMINHGLITLIRGLWYDDAIRQTYTYNFILSNKNTVWPSRSATYSHRVRRPYSLRLDTITLYRC